MNLGGQHKSNNQGFNTVLGPFSILAIGKKASYWLANTFSTSKFITITALSLGGSCSYTAWCKLGNVLSFYALYTRNVLFSRNARSLHAFQCIKPEPHLRFR